MFHLFPRQFSSGLQLSMFSIFIMKRVLGRYHYSFKNTYLAILTLVKKTSTYLSVSTDIQRNIETSALLNATLDVTLLVLMLSCD